MIAILSNFVKSTGTAIRSGFLLIHVVETVGASYLGADSDDHESREDVKELNAYKEQLLANGYQVQTIIGHGNPAKSIASIVVSENIDLVVMAAHGHRGIKDVLLGSTLDALRHKVKVPVLIAR